ncbi:MAG TPA: bifunctional phosphoglucose/phosphomannose isomerase [Acidimicrobiales bacterium]|nr:bifunctional phosphoglucose/phosphomannose isomerase [Acidimicrobiales bacterium]
MAPLSGGGSLSIPPSPLLVDSLDMWGATVGLPEQVEAAVSAARGLTLPHRERVENVVVLGMGGSGIAGDVLVATAAPFMPVPVTVVKGYEPPDYVGTGSLVFAVSFSGDTEETLEAATGAYEAGASLVVVAAGGALTRLADDWKVPIVPVPDDIPQPRAALGALAIPPLVLLEEIGLFPGAVQWVDQAVDQLRVRRDELLRPGNEAEEVARIIGRTIPLVHSSGDLGAAAALRWKAQVNENAKSPAFFNVYPEVCHNEVAGWGQNGDATRQVITLVNLRHDAEHPQVSRRFELVTDVLREVVADVAEVRAAGEGDLAQLLDLALVGDFVSLHLAGREGIDPGPIPILDEIKLELKGPE